MININKNLIVCDLDNTLYDWVHYFVSSFYDMADSVVKITGCDRERLLDDFRVVHQFHQDSEHPFSLLETDTVRQLFPGRRAKEIARQLDPAFHAFNSRRKMELKLHPGVRESLEKLHLNNVNLIAHTESNLYAVVDRLTRLDLTKYFSKIYCRERPNSAHPDPEVGSHWLDRFPMERVIELSHHQRKPDPAVLIEICETEEVSTESAAYVGDSMARDILMAKKANVFSIWAKYGAQHSEADYSRLVRISHWTKADVKRELELKEAARTIRPDFIADRSFSEVLVGLGLSTQGQ